MGTVQEIESAISSLSEKERWELLSRFKTEQWERGDRQIESDSEAGNLAALVREAEEEIDSGSTRPLDEITND